ncbi:AcrR family transcriptional regulator [Catenulispora sp. GAS73]|uniref:TetR/AcrR family transcriptional regulator n=1 Tax=Catenulispora sp. GAS73 TaxID=3156269 RepID=UPI0035192B75
MRVSSPDAAGRLTRADGRRNREALLFQAIELMAERGPAVPLDEIARAAGVGNATLYRHFPDRAALLRAIAAQVIGLSAQAAEQALDEEEDSFEALARYMREAIRMRVSWVMPAIASVIDPNDKHLNQLRQRSTDAIIALIANAQRDGALRPDLTFGDVGLLLVRLSRPLPPGQAQETQDAVAQRHLSIVLAGLRSGPDPLPASGLNLADLRRLGPKPFVNGNLGPADP